MAFNVISIGDVRYAVNNLQEFPSPHSKISHAMQWIACPKQCKTLFERLNGVAAVPSLAKCIVCRLFWRSFRVHAYTFYYCEWFVAGGLSPVKPPFNRSLECWMLCQRLSRNRHTGWMACTCVMSLEHAVVRTPAQRLCLPTRQKKKDENDCPHMEWKRTPSVSTPSNKLFISQTWRMINSE